MHHHFQHFAFLAKTKIYCIHKNSKTVYNNIPTKSRVKFGFLPVKKNGHCLDSKNGYKVGRFIPLASSASASSVGGSGAEYSEQLVDARRKQRRRIIAGIDQDELVEPELLADPDSCFCEFNGVKIHHKVYDAGSQEHESVGSEAGTEPLRNEVKKKIGIPMILLHGFGASLFSWSRVVKPLADLIGSKVLAFDRPAFGLTSRITSFMHSSSSGGDTKPLNPYSMAFSVLATLYFIDLLRAEKTVLVGHSAGSLVAVNAYFEAPERIAGLILVAPAIFSPSSKKKKVDGDGLERKDKTKEKSSTSKVPGIPFYKIFKVLSNFASYVANAVIRMVKGMSIMVNSLYKRALSAILRSSIGVMLVRMIIDKFGIAAVKNAWYDSNQVSDHVLSGYIKPLRTKDWDRALVEYTVAMLTDSEPKLPLAKRLHEIKCPVLIVTGDRDRLVPTWNSERLSRVIPGSSYEVIKNCGHLPHEEKVDEFVSIVEQFLHRISGKSEQQLLQAVNS